MDEVTDKIDECSANNFVIHFKVSYRAKAEQRNPSQLYR
jgi:hypothetical protein